MKEKFKYFILISFAVFLEYFRDYLFVNINLQIHYLENLINDLSNYNYTDSNLLYLIKDLDVKSLYLFKWVLSLSFAFLYFTIGFLFSLLFLISKTISFLFNYFSKVVF